MKRYKIYAIQWNGLIVFNPSQPPLHQRADVYLSLYKAFDTKPEDSKNALTLEN